MTDPTIQELERRLRTLKRRRTAWLVLTLALYAYVLWDCTNHCTPGALFVLFALPIAALSGFAVHFYQRRKRHS